MSFRNSDKDHRQRDLCFMDVETTGTIFGFHEIIDVACVRTNSNGSHIKGHWEAKIRPRNPERITEVARNINGYSKESWSTAPASSPELWEKFVDFVRGGVPVCHNPSFERAFISLETMTQGISDLGLDYHWIGTESLAWPLYVSGQVQRLWLEGLCEHFGFSIEPKPHRAMNGAKACYQVYRALMRDA